MQTTFVLRPSSSLRATGATNRARNRHPIQLVCSAEAAKPWADLRQRAMQAGAILAATALLAGPATAASSGRLTFDELQGKSYMEMKGSGMSSMCPAVSPEYAEAGIQGMAPGQYRLERFCMEPTAFMVKVPGDTDYKNSTLMTRLTYVLSDMTGVVTVGRDGTMEIKRDLESDGLDYAAVTVKARGSAGQAGEVPFLFSAKQLQVKGPADNMEGSLVVPSYRGATFFDTIGRGGASGWDWQKGLPGADQEKLRLANTKVYDPTMGNARFAVTKADPVTGEVEGVFITHQLSSDDMGAKPEEVCELEIRGVWYAQLLA